jgi:FKBP-type peptidyl-prolyl cis-trans isomerase FkpA
MKTRFRGMTGWLTRLVPTGLVGLVLAGCDAPPDIGPIAPPGAEVPRKSPDEEAAQAQGEMAAPAIEKKAATRQVVEYTPAVPTAPGETKTTPGGVKYETLKAGTGPELKAGQTAQFLYEGKLEDGKIFEDRSRRTNRPEMLSLSEKTKGWREALPGMHVGELRKLTVPPELAYGANGRPPEIPPNATLIYEVELVQILGE